MDKYFHPRLYNGYNYLPMLGFKLNHVRKRAPRSTGIVYSRAIVVWYSWIGFHHRHHHHYHHYHHHHHHHHHYHHHHHHHHPSLIYTWIIPYMCSWGVGPVYHSKLSCRSHLSRFSSGGHGHDELSFWTSANHRYVLHGRAIWVGGCGLPLPDRQSASSPGETMKYNPTRHITALQQVIRGFDPHCDVISDAKAWNTSRWWSQTWDTCLYFMLFNPPDARIGTEH